MKHAHSSKLLAVAGFTAAVLTFALAIGANSTFPYVKANPARDAVHSSKIIDIPRLTETGYVTRAQRLQSAANQENELRSEAQARIDMLGHAARHFGRFIERPSTFGGTEQWSTRWNLRWVDVQHGADLIRIYHIVEKMPPYQRFTRSESTDWEPVH